MRVTSDSFRSGRAAANPATDGAGLAAGTLIRTLDGLLPVEFLAPGDRIITRSGARRLVSLSIQDRRNILAVRVCASTLDRDLPEKDLILGPNQGVLVRNWRARAFHGTDQAVIPAIRLVDEEFIRLERHRTLRLFTLRCAEDEVIYAQGLELLCHARVTATTDHQPAQGG